MIIRVKMPTVVVVVVIVGGKWSGVISPASEMYIIGKAAPEEEASSLYTFGDVTKPKSEKQCHLVYIKAQHHPAGKKKNPQFVT